MPEEWRKTSNTFGWRKYTEEEVTAPWKNAKREAMEGGLVDACLDRPEATLFNRPDSKRTRSPTVFHAHGHRMYRLPTQWLRHRRRRLNGAEIPVAMLR